MRWAPWRRPQKNDRALASGSRSLRAPHREALVSRLLLGLATAGVQRVLDLAAALEADVLARLDLDRLAGRRVAAGARGALADGEAAEARDLHPLALAQRARDRVDRRLEGVGRLAPGQPRAVHNIVDDVSLACHPSPPCKLIVSKG